MFLKMKTTDTTITSRTVRAASLRLAGLGLALCLTLGIAGSGVAYADGGAAPSSSSASSSYDSLAAAYVAMWAKQSGSDLSSFVTNNASTLSGMLGTSSSNLATAGSTLNASSLNSLVSSSDFNINPSSMPSMNDLFSQLAAKSTTLDGAVTLNGASLANSYAGQYGANVAANLGSQDSLLFGLFYDKSLAHLASSSPNLFAQVSASGLGSPGNQAAWANAVAAATKASTMDLSKLPDQCGLVMMQAMGNGTASSSGSCGACAVAGTYLHTQLGRILDPSTNSVLPTTGTSTTNSSSWSNMQGWLQQGTLSQNPSLANQLNGQTAQAGSANACVGSSNATSGVLSTTLPGVFSNLGR